VRYIGRPHQALIFPPTQLNLDAPPSTQLPTMDDEFSGLLAKLPIEVRHNVFNFTVASQGDSTKVLRRWFEKKEVQKFVAEHRARDPNGLEPRIVYDIGSVMNTELLGEDDMYGDSSESGSDDDTSDDDASDEDVSDSDDDGEGEAEGEQASDVDADGDEEVGHAHIQAPGTSQSATSQAPAAPLGQLISPTGKWRHISKFMKLTHCPPPLELLLACKQLNQEAKNWYYDMSVLQIHATGSFAHTSFFEESLNQIADAAFSPMENLRKVVVYFIWDTAWIRAEPTGIAEAVFPALLRQRADFVHQILMRAPDLKSVKITWYDSVRDEESLDLMLDVLRPFHGLDADITVKDHFLEDGSKVRAKSTIGKRRIEFQAIADGGLDRLF
jgi:hypothetical protein